jgi:hypothetical protein
MNSLRFLANGVSVAALAAGAVFATGANAHPAIPPLHPLGHLGPHLPAYVNPDKTKSGTWTALTNKFPGSTPDTSVMMTDGTLITHDGCTSNWYKLTPDSTGSYVNGTWSQIASMPSGYAPLYFASQVMPDADSHVMVNGGEYNTTSCSSSWTKLGAIYDPPSNTWTAVTPPTGWGNIGDAQSVVLPGGSYMLADCCSLQEAIGTIGKKETVTWATTGSGKADENDEEGWTMLPDGNLLTVDANKNTGSNPNPSELYTTSKGTWSSLGNTASDVVDASSHELGPAPLLPNGTVFQVGATPNNNIFTIKSATWSAGPAFPEIAGQTYDEADGPAAVLPDGNVLLQASPGVFETPSHFFEYDGKTITQVNDTPDFDSISSYDGRMMVLPTGQVYWTDDDGTIEIYTPTGKPKAAWAPKITTAPTSVTHGGTGYSIAGKGLNGLTFGGYYGDDAQLATNFPLVQITNTGTGAICYGRTHDFARSVDIKAKSTTMFDVPSTCTTGASTLVVIANGIASKPVSVTVD